MSTARYFVTEQEEAAKNWAIIQRCKKLQGDEVRLIDELRSFSLDWRLLGDKTGNRDFSYRVKEGNIEVLRVDMRQSTDSGDLRFVVDSSVAVKHFDLPAITALLTDLSETKKELALVKSQLHKLGVNL